MRRVTGDEAPFILGGIPERLTLAALEQQEYFQMAEADAAAGLASGPVYDAPLGHCALKAKAKLIDTWNTKDFPHLSPAIAGRVKNPEPH